MDVEIIDENESPIRKQQKPKQLTLFDMKSKFTVKSSNGDESDARSPSPLKPLQSVLNTNNKASGKTTSKKTAPVKVDDQENSENVENAGLSHNTPVTKKSSKANNAKLQSKSPNIMEYFGKKEPHSVSETKNEKEEDSEATKPKQRKLTAQRQVKFSEQQKEEPAGPVVVTPFMSSSDIDQARMNLKERIQSLGTPALDTATSLKNWMFGDIASIIECYNNIMQYCKEADEKKEAKKRPKRRSRRVNKGKEEQQQVRKTMTSLDLYAIEYDQLVESIDKFDEDKKHREEFYRLIRNLIFFFVKMENLFEEKSLFGVGLSEIPMEESLLQEMCRLVILTLSEKEINKNWTPTEHGLSHTRDYLSERTPILKELVNNRSGIAFGDMEPLMKIELLRVFCDFLLYTKKYEAIKQEEETQIDSTTKRKQTNLDNLIAGLKINDEEFAKNRRKYLTEAKNSQSLVLVRAFEKYDKSLKKIQEHRDNLKSLERLEPIGLDFENNLYWSFSFYKGLVVEIKSAESSERESKWILFNNKKSSQSLLDFLRSTLKCGELVKELKTFVDTVFQGEEVEMTVDESPTESVQEDLFDDETEDNNKGKARYMTRNMMRKDVLNELMNGDGSSEGESENDEDDDPVELSGDVDNFDHYIPWIDSLKGDDSLKQFHLYLNNLARLIYFSGIATKTDYQSYKATLTSNNEDMFESNRSLMIDMLDLIANKMHFKHAFSFQESKYLTEYCKEYLQTTSSYSGICLMLYFFLCNIKWGNIHKSKKCGICSNKLAKFKMVSEVGHEGDEDQLGNYVCIRCYAGYHKQCVIDNPEEYEFTEKENLICAACKAKKHTYVIEELAPVVEEQVNEDPESSNGDRPRRKTKEVNYSEVATTTTTRRKRNPTSASSSFAETSTLSRSNSNSSIESLSTFNYKPQSMVYQTRSGRSSKSRFAQVPTDNEPSVPTRTSQRSRGNVKKYVYDDDDEE